MTARELKVLGDESNCVLVSDCPRVRCYGQQALQAFGLHTASVTTTDLLDRGCLQLLIDADVIVVDSEETNLENSVVLAKIYERAPHAHVVVGFPEAASIQQGDCWHRAERVSVVTTPFDFSSIAALIKTRVTETPRIHPQRVEARISLKRRHSRKTTRTEASASLPDPTFAERLSRLFGCRPNAIVDELIARALLRRGQLIYRIWRQPVSRALDNERRALEAAVAQRSLSCYIGEVESIHEMNHYELSFTRRILGVRLSVGRLVALGRQAQRMNSVSRGTRIGD